MKNFTLHDPWWILALLIIPAALWLRGRRSVSVVLVPFAAAWHRPSLAAASRWPNRTRLHRTRSPHPRARPPQKIEDKREVHSQGYDIILSIDLSGSMLAEDYEKGGQRINRLQAIKPVIQAFINNRPNDRIGIVVFSGAPTPWHP